MKSIDILQIFDSNTIIHSIRQDLAPALRALLEHGLYEVRCDEH